MFNRSLLMTCAVGAAGLYSGGVDAQTAPAPAVAPTQVAASSGTTIGELVVTAQRREENLQDTPVAVSAFSADTLKNEKVNGGEDLLLQVPNTNFTRTNFGGSNFKIRGIGTDVIGAGVGGAAGVSINENELPVTANHFQDANFFDVDRVEVVRGPQGTLYGRNATGGAVDIITTQPKDQFGGYASFQYGNYNQITATGAVNIPLGDALAVRVAGIRLVQDGFGTNTYLNQRVDGRDLGAIRATISFKPSDKFSAYLMYEHFGEDDNRNRVGKQLCTPDPGPAMVDGQNAAGYAPFLTQGCLPQSLYGNAAYGAVNSNATFGGVVANIIGLNNGTNVFATHPLQDHNLHNLESQIQPLYTAQEDLVDLHMAYNISDNLTLTSITGFNRDVGTNAADYNRIVPTTPFQPVATGPAGPLPLLLFPGGVVTDPQLGKTNLLSSQDYGSGESKEYTEELRLTSSYKGPFNFSVGAFYSEITAPLNNGTNYYVLNNAATALSQLTNAAGGGPVTIDQGYPPNGSGHNYYDARTGGGFLKSYAGFGEIYYDITPQLKLTLGGRYSVDQLYNLQYPQGLLTPGGGFPTTICSTLATCLTPQRLTNREFTGRANIDFTPTLSFTDKTLFYATFSRGYKGGGFNTVCQIQGPNGCGYPLQYNPEFINAYEAGTKNTLLGGSLNLNLTGFYYDYTGYQIAEYVSQAAENTNVNAKIYGLEFETVYSPIHNLTVNANVGYLHSALNGGQSLVDPMNLTQGNTSNISYTLVKSSGLGGVALGQNCLAPTAAVKGYIVGGYPAAGLSTQCALSGATEFGIPANVGGNKLPNTPPVTVSVGAQYVFELPNDWRATLRGDYYWQDNSFARIFNAANDQLQSYHIVNATLTFANVGDGVDLQLYVKNAFNAQPITGTYLSDPSTGLFTNVFTLDPRTYGVQLTKRF